MTESSFEQYYFKNHDQFSDLANEISERFARLFTNGTSRSVGSREIAKLFFYADKHKKSIYTLAPPVEKATDYLDIEAESCST
jgi:hypothetical protein